MAESMRTLLDAPGDLLLASKADCMTTERFLAAIRRVEDVRGMDHAAWRESMAVLLACARTKE